MTLQLQAICLEGVDTIHEALDNLPKSLPEIFHRILRRSTQPGKRYQMHILRILVAAFRPLNTEEFGEALSQSLDQSRQIGDIRGILSSSCGSLVMIDEQDLTVHLVHQSVRQFLLGQIVDTQDHQEWQFTSETAHLHMATVTMRYLNVWYSTVNIAKTDKGVSSSTTPQSPLVLLPNPVAVQRAAQAELKQGKLSKVLNMAAQRKLKGDAAPVDIGRTTERLWPGMFTKASDSPDHSSHLPELHFLAYAQAFWMLHSAPMTEDDGPLYLLWSQVLTASDTKCWLTWETPHVASHDAQIPEAIIWAVVHSHHTLLETMLRKQKRRLRLLNTCLEAFWGMSPLPRLSPMMAARFLTLHLFLQRCSVSRAQSILGMDPDFRYNNYACLYAAVFARDYHAARAILCAIGDPVVFNSLPYPLLELSVSRMDVHMTHLLLFHGVRPLHSSQVRASALALVMSRIHLGCDPSNILVASWLLKAWASTSSCPSHHLARALITLNVVANQRDFRPEQFISVPRRGWLAYYILYDTGKILPWLRGLFTFEVLAAYAAAIALLDVLTEFKAMLFLVLAGAALFAPVALRRFIPHREIAEAPRAFPPVMRSVATARFIQTKPSSTELNEPPAHKQRWKLKRGTRAGGWRQVN